MKLPRKVKFSSTWKHFTIIRPMTIGDSDFQIGDRFPDGAASTRRLRQLYEANRIWPLGQSHPALVVSNEAHFEQVEDWKALDFSSRVALARKLGYTGRIPPNAVLTQYLEQHAA